MERTALLRSRTTMITCLQIIVSHLENLHYSLSGYERNLIHRDMDAFATLVAENMENDPGDPITILLYSITDPASEEGRKPTDLRVVLDAILSLELGGKERSTLETSNNPLRLMWQDTLQKSGQKLSS